VEDQIRVQQNRETPVMRDFLNRLPGIESFMPEQKEALEAVAKSAIEKNKSLAASAAELVKPVQHTVVVEQLR